MIIAKTLGPNKCQPLSFFRSFTGGDTLSRFGGWGKKTAGQTLKSDGEVTAAFCAPTDIQTPRQLMTGLVP